MEAQQIIDLALNARLNFWPPHLGLKTDAEKIEYLATKLDEAATQIVNAEVLAGENETYREENEILRNNLDRADRKIIDLTENLKKIHELSSVQG